MTWLKWVGITAGGLVVLVLIAFAVVFVMGNGRLNRTFEVVGHEVAFEADSVSVVNGDRLASIYGCRECHGLDLGGDLMIDAPAFAVIAAPNLTRGSGGVGQAYTTTDLERAIRHGVAKDGRTLLIMPADAYRHLVDSDVADLLAFLTQMPSVDRSFEPRRFGPMARMAALFGGGEFMPAAMIDHDAPHRADVDRSPSPQFGDYMAISCRSCHGADLSGGDSDIAGSPPFANITQDEETGIGGWSYDEFEAAMRQGVTPDGRTLDRVMPWPAFARMTDDEMLSLYMYLLTVAPVRADRRP